MYENVKAVLNKFGKLLVEEYRNNLTEKNVNASYALYNSITYVVESNVTNFEVTLNLEEHWKYIEKGRKAGKYPPISAIEKWIEIKPVLPRPMSNGKLPTTKQLAYLIARKIGLEGIAPRPILQDSIDDVFALMFEELEEALMKDVQSEFNIIAGIL